MNARGRGRPRSGHELSDDQLLRAALAAFAEHGYEGTGVRELCRSLGVSHSLLGIRFGSKRDLWFAAMERPFDQLLQALARTEDPDDLEALRRGIAAYVRFAAAQPQVLRIMSHEGAIDSPRIRFIYDRYIHPVRERTEQLLGRLIAAGRIRPIPYAAFHLLVTHGGGAVFASRVEASLLGSPDIDADDVAELIADVIVGGLTTGEREADGQVFVRVRKEE